MNKEVIMTFHRLKYMALILLTIALGLLSRKIHIVPLSVGDGLYGVMIYFIIRFISNSELKLSDVIISIIICVSIELSQLYQADWINSVRSTLPGRLILGRGFLWSDVVAYIIGILMIRVIDHRLINRS